MNNEKDNEIPEFNEPMSFVDYITKYRGAIIGGVVALLFIVTGLSKLIVSLLVIVAGVVLGNYIQKNKTNVKTSLKEFIDKF